MIDTLTLKDIQNFLKRLSVAIALDQAHVDALPAERFSPQYDDAMWRDWRHGHRAFIDQLVLTADTMEPATLNELTKLSITRDPGLIGGVMLEIFAEIVCGSCSQEDCGSAEQFFGWLIEQVRDRAESKSRAGARISMLQWLPLIDPLRIAQDPECAYAHSFTFERETHPVVRSK
jgi:hypothetical protein